MRGPNGGEDNAITVSNHFPLVLRIIMGALASGMMVMLVRELGPGLWPFNIASLFFGVIVVGGLQVLLAFMLFVVTAPDMIWTFRPGRIEIEQRLFGKIDRFSLETEDMAIDLIRNEDNDGPDTWHLDLDANWPEPPGPQKWLRALFAFVPRAALPKAFLQNRMRSPAFSTSSAAEAARSLVLATKHDGSATGDTTKNIIPGNS